MVTSMRKACARLTYRNNTRWTHFCIKNITLVTHWNDFGRMGSSTKRPPTKIKMDTMSGGTNDVKLKWQISLTVR